MGVLLVDANHGTGLPPDWREVQCHDGIGAPNSFTVQQGLLRASPDDVRQFALVDVGSEAGTFECDWLVSTPGSKAGLVARYASPTSYFVAARDGLYNVDSLVFAYGGGAVFGPGDRMRVEGGGETIRVLRNGVQVLNVTISGGSATHYKGFVAKADGTSRWDTWAATDCPAPYGDAFAYADNSSLPAPWVVTPAFVPPAGGGRLLMQRPDDGSWWIEACEDDASVLFEDGFEDDVAGWVADDEVGGPSTFARSTAWSSEGSASFEATGFGGNGSRYRSTTYIPVESGHLASLTAILKRKGGTAITGWTFGFIWSSDSSGTPILGQTRNEVGVSGSVNDGPVGGAIVVPTGATHARVFFGAIGTAALYYLDDLVMSLQPVPRPLQVEATVTRPPACVVVGITTDPDTFEETVVYLRYDGVELINDCGATFSGSDGPTGTFSIVLAYNPPEPTLFRFAVQLRDPEWGSGEPPLYPSTAATAVSGTAPYNGPLVTNKPWPASSDTYIEAEEDFVTISATDGFVGTDWVTAACMVPYVEAVPSTVFTLIYEMAPKSTVGYSTGVRTDITSIAGTPGTSSSQGFTESSSVYNGTRVWTEKQHVLDAQATANFLAGHDVVAAFDYQNLFSGQLDVLILRRIRLVGDQGDTYWGRGPGSTGSRFTAAMKDGMAGQEFLYQDGAIQADQYAPASGAFVRPAGDVGRWYFNIAESSDVPVNLVGTGLTWSTTSSPADDATATPSTALFRSAPDSVRLYRPSAGTMGMQLYGIVLVPGRAYRFGVYLRDLTDQSRPGGPRNVTLQMQNMSTGAQLGVVLSDNVVGPNDWTLIQSTFIAPATGTIYRMLLNTTRADGTFGGGSGPHETFIDDWFVHEV